MFIIHSCSCIFQIFCHSLLGWHQCMCAHHVWSARSVRNLNFHHSTLLFYIMKIVTIYKLLCILNASVMVMLLTHILLQPSKLCIHVDASACSIESVKVVMLLTLLHILVAFMTAMLLMFLHILVAFITVMLLTAIHQRCGACTQICIFYCIF